MSQDTYKLGYEMGYSEAKVSRFVWLIIGVSLGVILTGIFWAASLTN